jgi:para-aminobenzoate synthetase/4-amino-4-deoxychorismate lyase
MGDTSEQNSAFKDLPNSSHISPSECFALLDDCDASSADPRSRLYVGYVDKLTCATAAELPALLDKMQQMLRQGYHAVALFSYELGASLHDIAPRADSHASCEILLFYHCQRLSADQVDAWLSERSGTRPAGITQVRANVDETEFHAAIARIHDYLEAGDTYQINYTYQLHFDVYGLPLALYRLLRRRQPVPYGALVLLPSGQAVLSLSPEQFVRHADGLATACPMKGTALATDSPERNARRGAALAADPKNRAENLMIVDLLRNDLGRVAVPGSVQVPSLFEVNRYGKLLQMTSIVQARLRDEVTLAETLTAIYPCGSITGAPKRRSMQIIRELEADARGLYTGAIGWFEAPLDGQLMGDFCLSVPIRTLELQAMNASCMRAGRMGVGAGIVHDSVASDEYAECAMKAEFLTGLPSDFELFETIRATRDDGCLHLDLHLQRLRFSAEVFGFACDEASMRTGLQEACESLPDSSTHRLRLALRQSGIFSIQTSPLQRLPEPVMLMLASETTFAGDLFLRHKTTARQRYDQAWREAEADGGFDMLFFNSNGELTEGARSNVFVKLDGRWTTPPLSAGVLPGIMRSLVLGDPLWKASERRLTLDDLRAAEEIVVCNALRGVMRARIKEFNS